MKYPINKYQNWKARLCSNRSIAALFLILVVGFVLYFPLLDNAFLSDDYRSLSRILVEKRILYRGVFRPLIDISFYINYLLSGLNPLSYYLVNILIHCFSAFMVYKVALRFDVFKGREQFIFAGISGFFFLIYPFHNESVAWLTGRLSSIACLCALIILYWSIDRRNPFQYFVPSVFVFLFALTGYESIIFLPAILLIWNWAVGPIKKQQIWLFISWIAVVMLYVALRYFISGTLTSEYGSRILNINSIHEQLSKLFKTTGRLFLPPMQNSNTMLGVFAGVGVVALVVHVVKRKTLQAGYWALMLSLLVSLILPVSFGVSTKTSEGDRLLYFPSVFFCIILAFWTVSAISFKLRWAVVAVVCSYFLVFLLKNNNQWELASGAVKSILTAARDNPDKKKIFVNLPETIEGGFVFRQGFPEALRVYGIDTTKVIRADDLRIPLESQRPDSNTIILYWDRKTLNEITLTK